MVEGSDAPKASGPALSAFCLRQQLSQSMYGAFSQASWLASWSLAFVPFFSASGQQGQRLQLSQEYTPVQVRLLSGNEVNLRIVSVYQAHDRTCFATSCAKPIHSLEFLALSTLGDNDHVIASICMHLTGQCHILLSIAVFLFMNRL